MKKFNKTLLCGLGLAVLAGVIPAMAQDTPQTPRVGLGQEAAQETVELSRLRLTDPLVQQKYLNEPDMLRFLRATYSEGCVRSNLVNMAQTVKADLKKEFTPEVRNAMSSLLLTQRIWKLSSFEMEAVFPVTYIRTAFYCDCAMKEVTSPDLVDPKSGFEVMKNLPESTLKMCRQASEEKAEKYKSLSKK